MNAKDELIEYVMETPENSNRQVLEGLVEGVVDESGVQSDWNQNDTTAKDYIKNRPCYKESSKKQYNIVVGTSGEYTFTNGSIPLALGQSVSVIVNKIGSEKAIYTTKVIQDSNKELCIDLKDQISLVIYSSTITYLTEWAQYSGAESVDVIIDSLTIHKIDPEYIKDMYYEEEVITELGNTIEVWKKIVNFDSSSNLSKVPITYKVNGKIYENVTPLYADNRYIYNSSVVDGWFVVIHDGSLYTLQHADAPDFQFIKKETIIHPISEKYHYDKVFEMDPDSSIFADGATWEDFFDAAYSGKRVALHNPEDDIYLPATTAGAGIRSLNSNIPVFTGYFPDPKDETGKIITRLSQEESTYKNWEAIESRNKIAGRPGGYFREHCPTIFSPFLSQDNFQKIGTTKDSAFVLNSNDFTTDVSGALNITAGKYYCIEWTRFDTRLSPSCYTAQAKTVRLNGNDAVVILGTTEFSITSGLKAEITWNDECEVIYANNDFLCSSNNIEQIAIAEVSDPVKIPSYFLDIPEIPEFFIVKMQTREGWASSDKTAKEIYDAYAAGKVVLARVNGAWCPLQSCFGEDTYTISFSSISMINGGQNYMGIIYQDNVSASSTRFELYWNYDFDKPILPSSTPNSTKKFKITVDDSGTLSATEVTEGE